MAHEPTISNHGALGRVQSIATIFSLVAVPVIVAVLGALIQKSIQTSEARNKSMELAINILKESPGKSDQPGLREWAIETLQASSSIPISDAARRELATKPLFPIQPSQRNYGTGGFITFNFEGGPFKIEEDDPTDNEKMVTLHKFVLQRVDQDSIDLLVDGKPMSLYINDSLALAPEGCVLHLLAVGRRPKKGDEEQVLTKLRTEHFANLDEMLKRRAELLSNLIQQSPLNDAFAAYVCP